MGSHDETLPAAAIGYWRQNMTLECAATFGQFAGLGVAGGLPGLETFKGLNDGFAKL